MYAANVAPVTASKFIIHFDVNNAIDQAYIGEINGYSNLQPNTPAKELEPSFLDNGPYRIFVLDEVTGRLVSVEIGADDPLIGENDGGAGTNPLFTQLD